VRVRTSISIRAAFHTLYLPSMTADFLCPVWLHVDSA
jgi:hypothetical protein